MPMIGMTTMLHGTVLEQPKDSFSVSDLTSNWMSPVPSSAVNAATSAAGSAASIDDSGAMVVSLQLRCRVPSAAANGSRCWLRMLAGNLAHSSGHDVAESWSRRSAAVAYLSCSQTAVFGAIAV